MMEIPRPALFLGLAGLIPFLYGALTAHVPGVAITPLHGAPLLNAYGVIILCFMAGVLWGFAAKGDHPTPYVLSVAPAVVILILALFWPAAFFGEVGLVLLVVCFVGLLGLDHRFAGNGFTPGWWMRLRMLLTSGVAVCLLAGAAA